MLARSVTLFDCFTHRMLMRFRQTYEGAFAQSPGLEAHGKLLARRTARETLITSSIGGPTYCALASKALYAQATSSPSPVIHQHDTLLAWLVHRQIPPDPSIFADDEDSEDDSPSSGSNDVAIAIKTASMAGFSGRANKEADACYSFWIDASLRVGPCNPHYSRLLTRCRRYWTPTSHRT